MNLINRDFARSERQRLIRNTCRGNGRIRRGIIGLLASFGAGVVIGQSIELIIWLCR